MLMSLDPAPSDEQATEQLDGLTKIVGPVKITNDETVEVCGIHAKRLIATTAERDQQYDYLNLVYHVGDNYYPVQLRNQMHISDAPLFSADVDAMFQGFQIG